MTINGRPLRVLHLPANIASQVSVTVRALREIGVEARGLVVEPGTMQSSAGVEVLPPRSKRQPLTWLRWWRMLAGALRWADVVHWHFAASVAPRALDVRLVHWLRKPAVVEFWGSDIRIPELAIADNPYLARISQEHEYGQFESLARSRTMQGLFARAGFACLVPSAELLPYVQPDLFPHVYRSRQRVVLADYPPSFPDPAQTRPRVVHCPSAKAYKGTPAVMAAVEQLQSRLDFEFVLVHGVPKEQAQQIMGTADIYLDQFVGGDYGVAAVEAMAFGKPVVCYIKPSVAALQPSCVINATQENLTAILEPLIRDGRLRHTLGQQSRAYAETHHDAHRAAHQLAVLYQELIQRV